MADQGTPGRQSMLASLRAISAVEIARSLFFATGIFIIGGSIAALWNNPLFVRMTPVAGYEYFLLAAESALAGLYLGLKAPSCSISAAGSGTALGFVRSAINCLCCSLGASCC